MAEFSGLRGGGVEIGSVIFLSGRGGGSGVEVEEDAVFQFVDAGGDGADGLLEGDGYVLELVVGEVEDFADVVDDEADGFVGEADDEVHAGEILRGAGQAEPFAEVDGGDDLAAEVDEAADDGGGEGDAGHGLGTENLLNEEDFDAEEHVVEGESANLFGHGLFGHGLV
jgi:hypothetical protein